MESQPLRALPANRPIRIANRNCIYCGSTGETGNPLTNEHVIGRRFVPKGSLACSWCLIARACERCNREKADLEDDISAISLMHGAPHSSPKISAQAKRKATGSRSRRTGKPVAESHEENEIAGQFMPGVDFKFGFIGPPGADVERLRRLAWFHLQGFFYFITYDEAKAAGGFIPGGLGWLNEAARLDWGNSLQMDFARLVLDWEPRLEGTAADGFFRISIRRDPSDIPLWGFALEWNKSMRIIGFFGDIDVARTYAQQFKPLEWRRVDPTTRVRREIQLDEAEDVLFPPQGDEQVAQRASKDP